MGTVSALSRSNDDSRLVTEDPNRVPLKRIRQALAAVDTTPLAWWALGDSITEGKFASTLDTGHVNQLLRTMQRRLTGAGRGGSGYLNTYSSFFSGSAGSSDYWVFSGGGSGAVAAAFFGNRRRSFAAGETATLTFTGTSFRMHYRQGDVTSIPFTVAIDGGAPVTITPSTTGGGNTQGVFTSATLVRAVHTVVVAPVNPANTMIVYGATLRDGDETSGIRCYNGGLSGATSTSYLSTPGNSWVDQQAVTGDPALVTIGLGVNDYRNSISPTLTQSNLTSLIANVKSACTVTPSFLFVIEPQVFVAAPSNPWSDYVAAIMAAAAADQTNIAVVDTGAHFVDVPTSSNAYTRGLINSDQTHPTDAGHRLIAQLVTARILSGQAPLELGQAASIEVVKLVGNQSVDGVKTFTSPPVGPTPVGTTDLVNKSYADALAGAGVPDATTSVKGKLQLMGDLGGTAASPTTPTAVHISGAETIAGVKTFSNSPIGPTPVGTTDLVNKAYADALTSAGAPDATASSKGIVQLTGDLGGTAASPTVPGKAPKLNITPTKTGAYTALAGDFVVCDPSGGAFTVTLPAATLGAIVGVYKGDSSGNAVTVNAAGADTIGVVSTVITVPLTVAGQVITFLGLAGGWVYISGFHGVPIPNIQLFTASGTWTKPAGVTTVRTVLASGGTAGASGRVSAAGVAACGGGGGGGGAVSQTDFRASDLPATVAVTIGTGGTPGAAQATGSTNGNSGGIGNVTTFGTYARSHGGASGGATISLGGTSALGTGGPGMQGVGGLGGAATSNAAGATGFGAGAGGGSASTTGLAGSAGGAALGLGGSGGGAGGGITVANVAAAGGAGAGPFLTPTVTAGTGGAVGGAIPTAGADWLPGASGGAGGGGGAAALTGAAQDGAAGGAGGGGGGGGGAARDGGSSGAGGAGGIGAAYVISH